MTYPQLLGQLKQPNQSPPTIIWNGQTLTQGKNWAGNWVGSKDGQITEYNSEQEAMASGSDYYEPNFLYSTEPPMIDKTTPPPEWNSPIIRNDGPRRADPGLKTSPINQPWQPPSPRSMPTEPGTADLQEDPTGNWYWSNGQWNVNYRHTPFNQNATQLNEQNMVSPAPITPQTTPSPSPIQQPNFGNYGQAIAPLVSQKPMYARPRKYQQNGWQGLVQ